MDIEAFSPESPGRFAKTSGGHAAFVPGPAPRELALSPESIDLLDAASNRLGVLEGIGRRLSNPELLIGPYLRQEAVLSSRIEGTQTTLSDLYATEARLQLPVAGDVQEVLNYSSAYRYGLERLDALPLSLRLIRELHERLLLDVRGSGTQPGAFRTYQNFIGGSSEANAAYVPPPPSELVGCLDDLERFIHEKAHRPLVQMAILHYQFEAIHPFGDGNGRVGRLLMGVFLTERGLMPQPLLYLSPYFERTRRQYYGGLMRVSTHGDWESWIRYVLKGVRIQADAAIELADRLQSLHADYRDRVRRMGRSVKALALVDAVFLSPFVTTRIAQEQLGVSAPTARAAIAALQDAGILREYGEPRRWQRIYIASELYDLISPGELDAGRSRGDAILSSVPGA
ncbi:MAG: Fic family protein [Gaiellaceae bacterium MAG52_C11]|nr:Fic family protein [Candidatus Gaiellasilicea maunaloa]